MFRYRQTQHLQKNLEERFGELLKPFGIGTEPQKREAQRPPKRASTTTRKAAEPRRTAKR